MSSPRVRSHASAVWAGVAPTSAPMARTSSTMARFRTKFSPVNLGFVLRQSSSAKSSTERIWPVRRPCPSGEYGTKPMPSREAAARSQPRGRGSRASTPSARRTPGGQRGPDGWSRGWLRIARSVGPCPRQPGRQRPLRSPRSGCSGQRGAGSRGRCSRSRADARSLPPRADIGRTAVHHTGVLAVGVRHETELGRDDDLIAAPRDGPADDFLAVERTVDLRGVEVGDAEVEGTVDGADGLRVVQGTFAGVCASHRHRTETDAGDLEASQGDESSSLYFLAVEVVGLPTPPQNQSTGRAGSPVGLRRLPKGSDASVLTVVLDPHSHPNGLDGNVIAWFPWVRSGVREALTLLPTCPWLRPRGRRPHVQGVRSAAPRAQETPRATSSLMLDAGRACTLGEVWLRR